MGAEAERQLKEAEGRVDKLTQQLADTHMELGEASRKQWEADEELEEARGKLQEEAAGHQALQEQYRGAQVRMSQLSVCRPSCDMLL